MSDDLHCRYCHVYGDESEIDAGSSACWDEDACGLRCQAIDEELDPRGD